VDKQGHCCPHYSIQLVKWCSSQRNDFRANSVWQDRIDKLATIGFQFVLRPPKNAPKKYLTWEDRYNQLVVYKNEHGHANPKQTEGQLGIWCHNQRRYFIDELKKNGNASRFTNTRLISLLLLAFSSVYHGEGGA
jgi:hypothetical protein